MGNTLALVLPGNTLALSAFTAKHLPRCPGEALVLGGRACSWWGVESTLTVEEQVHIEFERCIAAGIFFHCVATRKRGEMTHEHLKSVLPQKTRAQE